MYSSRHSGAGGSLQKARGWTRQRSSAASGASSRSGARASDSKSRSSCYYKTGNVAEGPRPNDSRAIGARTRSCTKNRTKTYWCGRRVCACRRKSRGTDTSRRLRPLHDFARPPHLLENGKESIFGRHPPHTPTNGADGRASEVERTAARAEEQHEERGQRAVSVLRLAFLTSDDLRQVLAKMRGAARRRGEMRFRSLKRGVREIIVNHQEKVLFVFFFPSSSPEIVAGLAARRSHSVRHQSESQSKVQDLELQSDQGLFRRYRNS